MGRGSRDLVLVLAFLLAPPAQVRAGEKAAFIAGTYAMEGRCKEWQAIENGGERNVETVPETLTAEGFSGWEGGCAFLSVNETEKGRRWEARMACAEAAEEWDEVDVFELDPAGRITVTTDGQKSVYVRCDDAKGH